MGSGEVVMQPHHVGALESMHAAPQKGAGPVGLVPFELDIAATPGAPAAARAAVSDWIGHHVTDAMLVDLRLLIGELVANSVLHADAPANAVVSVRAEVCADAVHIEVGDSGTGGAVVVRAPDFTDGGGFGLNVVDVLSRRWGVNRDMGTRVWAELAFASGG
jgi:anti-sigma regulatory factor (Ser/Thr protein kinase)